MGRSDFRGHLASYSDSKEPFNKLRFDLTGNESFEYVQNLFVEEYRRQRRKRIEASILSPFGIGLDQFMLSGRSMFNERDHESIILQIKACDLGAELLVSGFDAEKDPHIFSVCDPGIVTDYSKIGFWSVGSGNHSALGVMFANKYDASEEVALCIYKVLAAKFAAESAEGVGKDTVLYILNPIFPIPLWLSAEEIDAIRKKYDSLKRVPDGIESQIKDCMLYAPKASRNSLVPQVSPQMRQRKSMKTPKSPPKPEAAKSPTFTRAEFHKLIDRAITPPAPKPDPKAK